ncbi:MAG: DNA-binding response regulator [Clostridiales bacterium]|nr:MAG: DNA-binding response regulator [Clostridiales bacterium]
MAEKIKTIIVDDHEIIRDSLVRIISGDQRFAVIGAFENGKRAYQFVEQRQVDFVLMDVVMPVMGGIESARLIKAYNPSIKVLLLTTFSDKKLIVDAYRVNIDGYILKDISADDLIEQMIKCLHGDFILPNQVAHSLLGDISKAKIYDFNETEMRIIDDLISGLSNKEIAEKLNIGYGTVRNYVSNIYHKLGESDRNAVITKLKRIKRG